MAAVLAVAGISVALRGFSSVAAPRSVSVSPAAIQSAAGSVVRVRCTNTNVSNDWLSASGALGTGFVTRGGIVTASHVISTCAGAGPGSVSAGPFVVSVGVNDPAQDLALMRLGPASTAPPLPLAPALPSPGTQLELIGSPGDGSGTALRPVAGTVLATNTTVTLHSEAGGSETLSDTIVVAASGVVPGDSGGPAINAASQVVGVIEGGNDDRAYLTPASDVTSVIG